MLQRQCTHCGQSNRIPAKHAAHQGKCGRCKEPLPPIRAPIDVESAAQFHALRQEVDVPILVDFWAAWCGPCKMAAPEIAKLAADSVGEALVLKVNTEALPELAEAYGVRSIPNFVVLLRGKTVRQEAGLRPASEMRRWLHTAAAA